MINSWMKFFIAVEQMRECQKAYFANKNPLAFRAAEKCADEVDACIKQKREEWSRDKQPELFTEGV